jgi:hypothetical protein
MIPGIIPLIPAYTSQTRLIELLYVLHPYDYQSMIGMSSTYSSFHQWSVRRQVHSLFQNDSST